MNSIVEFYINYRVIAEIISATFAFLLTAGVIIYFLISWRKNKRR